MRGVRESESQRERERERERGRGVASGTLHYATGVNYI